MELGLYLVKLENQLRLHHAMYHEKYEGHKFAQSQNWHKTV